MKTTELSYACRNCGSTDQEETRLESGPHYARISCKGCGKFVKFRPWPQPGTTGEPPSNLVQAARSLNSLAKLRGSAAQIRWAESIRENMLAEAWNLPDHLAVLKAIADASWFIANRSREIKQLRWPGESALDSRKITASVG